MRALTALISATAIVWSAAAFAADPVGSYDVEGSNPGGGSSYKGKVTIEKTGQTYRVTWVVGGTRRRRGLPVIVGTLASPPSTAVVTGTRIFACRSGPLRVNTGCGCSLMRR